MAEDFDLDRVINDPAYRRKVIARLNFNAPQGEAHRIDAPPSIEVAPAVVHRTLTDQECID